MRRAALAFLAAPLLSLCACNGPWVLVGYNHAAPVAGARTYSIARVKMAVTQYEPTARAAVVKDLAHHGWQLVPSGGSETVFVFGDVQNAGELAEFYTHFGNGWQPAAWGAQGRGEGWKKSDYGEVDAVALGNPGNKLVIDIFDSGSHQLLLRAVAENQLWYSKEKKNTKVLDKTIHKMLKHVPS